MNLLTTKRRLSIYLEGVYASHITQLPILEPVVTKVSQSSPASIHGFHEPSSPTLARFRAIHIFLV